MLSSSLNNATRRESGQGLRTAGTTRYQKSPWQHRSLSILRRCSFATLLRHQLVFLSSREVQVIIMQADDDNEAGPSTRGMNHSPEPSKLVEFREASEPAELNSYRAPVEAVQPADDDDADDFFDPFLPIAAAMDPLSQAQPEQQSGEESRGVCFKTSTFS